MTLSPTMKETIKHRENCRSLVQQRAAEMHMEQIATEYLMAAEEMDGPWYWDQFTEAVDAVTDFLTFVEETYDTYNGPDGKLL